MYICMYRDIVVAMEAEMISGPAMQLHTYAVGIITRREADDHPVHPSTSKPPRLPHTPPRCIHMWWTRQISSGLCRTLAYICMCILCREVAEENGLCAGKSLPLTFLFRAGFRHPPDRAGTNDGDSGVGFVCISPFQGGGGSAARNNNTKC